MPSRQIGRTARILLKARPDGNGDNLGAAFIRVTLVNDLATTTAALVRLVKVL